MEASSSPDPRAWSSAAPWDPAAAPPEPPVPAPPPRRWPGRLLLGLTVLVLVVAGAVFVSARRADDRAVDARRASVRLHTVDRRTAAEAERVSHAADGPIGVAEKVSTSLSRILGATGAVIDAGHTADERLAHAVDVANAGSLGTARSFYTGEVADAVRVMQTLLANVQQLLGDARTAAVELAGQAS